MSGFRVGDIVARRSYGSDLLFRVQEIIGEKVILKGISYRIEADAHISDLEIQKENKVIEYHRKSFDLADRRIDFLNRSARIKSMKRGYYRNFSYNTPIENYSASVKILHIDGDSDYLSQCVDRYKKLGLDVIGEFVQEREQASGIYKLLSEIKPDILVLTGHDGFIKGDGNYFNIDNYRNSKYFIEAVKEARRYERDMDDLIIFAGACQSMYYNIIRAGANYASSPYRVLIHALDPVFVCQKIAFTEVNKIIKPKDVIGLTITGYKGIGGLETKGKMRQGFPLEPNELGNNWEIK